jgi:hypothetical protein
MPREYFTELKNQIVENCEFLFLFVVLEKKVNSSEFNFIRNVKIQLQSLNNWMFMYC